MEEKEELKKPEMEEKENQSKKSKGNIIFVLLIIIILGLIGYICYDKGLILNNNKTNEPTEKIENKEPEEKINITEEELEIMDKVSKSVFSKEEKFTKDELQGQVLIETLSLISNKHLTEITGTELKELAKKYFNLDNIEFVGISCGMEHEGDNNYLIYNQSTDKYEFNENHPGHGGVSGTSDGALNYKESEVKNGTYLYKMAIFYKFDGCDYDICGPTEKYEIYQTKNDLINKTNKLLDATKEGYCSEYIQDGQTYYNCDDKTIYEQVKDKLKTVTFKYKKIDNRLIFDSYSFDK